MKSSATKTALTSIVIASCIGIGVGKKFEKKIEENKELTKNLEQVTNTVNFLEKKVKELTVKNENLKKEMKMITKPPPLV